MSLDTNKSNLTRTKISNCADTLDVRNYLLSLDTNKQLQLQLLHVTLKNLKMKYL